MCPFYSTMSISTRLSLVLIYLCIHCHLQCSYCAYLFIHCHLQCSYCNKSWKCGIFVMAFYYTHNTRSKWHGLYALVQVITNRLCYRHTPVRWCMVYELCYINKIALPCLYKLRPNTEQRHAIRTVRNIVNEHRWAHHITSHHIKKSMCPPHGIMGRLCRHITI